MLNKGIREQRRHLHKRPDKTKKQKIMKYSRAQQETQKRVYHRTTQNHKDRFMSHQVWDTTARDVFV